jgi:hypothetical protein
MIQELLEKHTLCTDQAISPLVIYCYKNQPPRHLVGVVTKIHQGLPNIEEVRNLDRQGRPLVLVLDDLMGDLTQLTTEQQHQYTSLIIDVSRKEKISRK